MGVLTMCQSSNEIQNLESSKMSLALIKFGKQSLTPLDFCSLLYSMILTIPGLCPFMNLLPRFQDKVSTNNHNSYQCPSNFFCKNIKFKKNLTFFFFCYHLSIQFQSLTRPRWQNRHSFFIRRLFVS